MMLAIKSSTKKTQVCSPNVLPCQIKHDGPVDAQARFWKPVQNDGMLQSASEIHALTFDVPDNTSVAYFRGRKLQGKKVDLPEGYRGSVLQTTTQKLPQPVPDAMDDEYEDGAEEVKIVEEVASFEDITLWGHDMLPVAEDAYSKGLTEWIALAEAVRPNKCCSGVTAVLTNTDEHTA